MKWEDYAAEFDFDGSLRDIYVLETSLADWQMMFDFLRSSQYEFQYHRDGPGPLPSSYVVFDKKYDYGGYLSIIVGTVTLSCHFFCHEEIEFDFDPRDVKGEEQANSIFDFMRQLGRALNKEVILTPESSQEILIFKFSLVTRKIEFFPVIQN